MRNLVWLKATCLGGLILAVGCGGGEAETKPTNTPTTTSSATAPTPTTTTAPVATTAQTAPKKPLAELIHATLGEMEACMTAHDASKCAPAFAADLAFAQPGPNGWRTRNKDEVVKNLDTLFKGFPDLKITPTRTFMKGNEVAIEGVMTGTNSGEFMGRPATNKKIGHRYLMIMTFNDDGLIKAEHLYHDHATMMGHLGHGDAKLKFRDLEAVPTVTVEQVSPADNAHEAKNTDAAKAWLATWEKKDEKGYLAGLADDITKANYMHHADFKGKDAVKKAFAELNKSFADIKMTPTEVIAIGDYVIAEVDMNATMKADLGSVKSSGKPGTAHIAEVLKFNKDGKIAWVGRFGSRAEFATAFGVPVKMLAASSGNHPAAPGAAAPAGGAKK